VAAPAYTTRVLAGVLYANTSLSYTVPAGQRLVIRDFEIYGGAQSFVVNLEIRGVTVVTQLYTLLGEPVQTQQWKGRVAVDAGETLDVKSSQGDGYVTVTGYLLSAV
jgi:hypothetical protein